MTITLTNTGNKIMPNLIDLHDDEIFNLIKHGAMTREEFEFWLSERLDETWNKAIDLVSGHENV